MPTAKGFATRIHVFVILQIRQAVIRERGCMRIAQAFDGRSDALRS